MTVGSVRLDADPGRLPRGIRLVDGQALDAASVDAVRRWLVEYGDEAAASERWEVASEVEQRVRAELEAAASEVGIGPPELAVRALNEFASTLPAKAGACIRAEGDP